MAVSRIAYEKTNGRPASQYASTLQIYKEIPVYRIITASSTVKSIFLHSNPDADSSLGRTDQYIYYLDRLRHLFRHLFTYKLECFFTIKANTN